VKLFATTLLPARKIRAHEVFTVTSWCSAILVLCLGGWAAGASANDVQGRNMAAACSGCHGTYQGAHDGVAPLAGGSKDDFVRRMQDYKTGRKQANLMHQLAKGYTDAQIEQLGSYFASLKK